MREEGIVENAARDRRGRARSWPARARGAAPGDRRGPRARRLLGARPRHATGRRASRSRRTAARRRAMNALVGGVQGARAAAVHQLQPAARRPAVHRHRRGGQGGPGDPRRGLRSSRRPLHRLSLSPSDPRPLAGVSGGDSCIISGWRRGPLDDLDGRGGCRNASRATGSPCQRRRRDERVWSASSRSRPGVVVGRTPALAAEQHAPTARARGSARAGAPRLMQLARSRRVMVSAASTASRYAAVPLTASENHSGSPRARRVRW